MAWVRLSDGGGSFEVTVFSEVLNAAREVLKAGNAVLMGVELKLEGETLRITAADCIEPRRRRRPRPAPACGSGSTAPRRCRISAPCWRAGRTAVAAAGSRWCPRLDEAQAVEITLPGGFQVTPAAGAGDQGWSGWSGSRRSDGTRLGWPFRECGSTPPPYPRARRGHIRAVDADRLKDISPMKKAILALVLLATIVAVSGCIVAPYTATATVTAPGLLLLSPVSLLLDLSWSQTAADVSRGENAT